MSNDADPTGWDWDGDPAAGMPDDPADPAGPAGPDRAAVSTPGVATEQAEQPTTYFDTLDQFVGEFLAPTFGRDLLRPELTWCPQWWQHPEAVYRLESLWRSWEHLRTEPHLGSSTWLSHHLDHHLPVLLDARGPFKGCGPSKGHTDHDLVLPCDPAPGALFAQ